ncbi:hypothetical protein AB4027_00470 [Alkalibacterium putridalgicola]|uniref:hypothetical protein n=1 Tax=Alkalibacterium putridalgicola TaxID=426703 RepID=UPI0034CF3F21
MTKYIKLTSLLLFIAVALTGFSFYNAQASSPYPELNIVTSQGKPEYAEPLQFMGFVADAQNYSNSSTVIFKNGDSLYREDIPFPKRMDFGLSPNMNELITDYRSFMRGKSRRPEHYVETDNHLIYAAMEGDVHWGSASNGQLTIAVLDKETEAEKTFEVDLSGQGQSHEVRAAYVNYPSLTLFVNNYSGESQDLIYTVDLENPAEELTATLNLSKETGTTGIYTSLHIVQSFDKTERFLLLKSVSETAVSEFDYTTETTGYYAYDTQTQEVIEIPLFEEEETLLFTDNDSLYAGKDLGEAIELYEVNSENQETDLVGTIEMVSATIGRDFSDSYSKTFNQSMTISNGKLYAYEVQTAEAAGNHSAGVTRPIFQVSDIQTQETLFQGTVEPRDSSKHDAISIELYEFGIDPSAE